MYPQIKITKSKDEEKENLENPESDSHRTTLHSFIPDNVVNVVIQLNGCIKTI